MERAAALVKVGRFQEALPLAERILKEYPNNHIYLRRMAEIRGQLGQHREEAALWERFMKVAPSPGEACPAIGNAYRNAGDRVASIGAFERCLALEPRNADFRFYLAKACEDAKQFSRAQKLYREASQAAPEYPDLAIGWARMEVFVGDAKRARGLMQKLLAKNARNTDALLVLGMAHRQLGEYEAAREVLERGLRLSPSYSDFLAVLGGVAEGQDRPDEARACYDRYLAQRPGDAAIQARRARLRGELK